VGSEIDTSKMAIVSGLALRKWLAQFIDAYGIGDARPALSSDLGELEILLESNGAGASQL